VDRAPGLSVRLKLTLSYAGFLMLAGAVLLAAGYFSLSRGVHPGVVFMVRSHADLPTPTSCANSLRSRPS
jgi:two-component system, OmpR family, sensor histidine kinase VanS